MPCPYDLPFSSNQYEYNVAFLSLNRILTAFPLKSAMLPFCQLTSPRNRSPFIGTDVANALPVDDLLELLGKRG